jgi:hypothetical protein
MKGSQSYQLAHSMRGQLLRRFQIIEQQLSRDGYKNILNAFQACILGGTACINMSIPTLNRFLKTGRWLNIYEAVYKETGKTGDSLEKEVSRRIPNWYKQRRTIDNLLRFRRDTHYASLNIGGPGAHRYGVCCVIFDLSHWAPYHTCFGGDSIRACFDAQGSQVLMDHTILENFGIGQDVYQVAVIKHQEYLRQTKPGLDPNELRDILEASDSLIEFHLPGPMTRDHIVRIVMSRGQRNHYWELSKRSFSIPKPWPQEYDIVPFFLEMNQLLERYNIPFLMAEGN